MTLLLKEGDVVVDRFEIRGLAGFGGMGAVYEAQDRAEGGKVALKVLSATSGVDHVRFQREALVLSELSHPAIVRYVAHGRTPAGAPFLAMEWLTGEDLGARLARSQVTMMESLGVARRAAAALAVAHGRGIIHRDIKPSNLFLVGRQPDQVKVVDFGLARQTVPTRPMTSTGAVIGTLGYMAPEQARGERGLDPRSDVFALGCVLFECLTGRAAFTGPDVVAVLVKILSGKVPRVRDQRPEVPGELDDLVARMMARDPSERPRDGAALLELLDAVELRAGHDLRHDSSVPRAISKGEQRLLSILLMVEPGQANIDARVTLTPREIDQALAPIRDAVEPFGGETAQLADGTVMVLLKVGGSATDQTARAAICALSLVERAQGRTVALATGPAEITGQWPEGQVIDRAAELLRRAREAGATGVYIDDVTTELLDTRFLVEPGEIAQRLLAEQALAGARQLLGKPTPHVGRARELAFLESYVEECVAEPTAGVVLVTGPAGMGKSRLGLELVEKIRREDKAAVMVARGDPVAAGSALSMASQLVRRTLRLHHGEDAVRQHAMLRAALELNFDGQELVRVAEFLGELVGAHAPDEPSPQLRAARNDARIMGEQLRIAFEDWIGAQCRERPVLLVIEDLQWADLPSVSLVEGALRAHSRRPLVVLALARPEISSVFPGLWTGADAQGIQLGALKRSAAEQLVRAVLGPDVSPATVERIVSKAGGNAFYLEELIRHVAAGADSDFPEAVLALAQSRLESLDPELRRVLRAAAVFGASCWFSALRKLLGRTMSEADLSVWLDVLVEREILEPGREVRFPGQRELVFRHDLLREAAYAMLTDEDRVLAHRLAGEWLEEAGERDALVLAAHFVKGGLPARAVPHFARAAQAALDGGNLASARELSQRGLECGAVGEDRGLLRLIQMLARALANELSQVSEPAREAMRLLPPGSTRWFQALSGLAVAGSWGGDTAALLQTLQALNAFKGELRDVGPLGFAGNVICDGLLHIGQRAQAEQLGQRFERALAASASPEPVFEGWVYLTRVGRALLGHSPLGDALPNNEAAVERFAEGRSVIGRMISEAVLAWTQLHVGLVIESLQNGRGAHGLAASLRIPLPYGFAALFLAFAQALSGRAEEALSTLEPLPRMSNPLLAAYARSQIALAQLALGRPEEAEREAALAVESSSIFPIAQVHALGELAAAHLALGRPEEALGEATRALEAASRFGMDRIAESLLRLTHVRALDALGRTDDLRRALAHARDDLLGQAASLRPVDLRDRYLRDLPPNAELLALARERLPAEAPAPPSSPQAVQ